MIRTSVANPARTIAILGSYCLVWFGLLQSPLSGTTLPIAVCPHQWKTSDGVLTQTQPYVIVRDLETDQDVADTIRLLRESAPPSKIGWLSGVEDKEPLCQARARGIDSVVLTVQPPAVLLSTIMVLYIPTPDSAKGDGNGVAHRRGGTTLLPMVDSEVQRSVSLDAKTKWERELIQLVGRDSRTKGLPSGCVVPTIRSCII